MRKGRVQKRDTCQTKSVLVLYQKAKQKNLCTVGLPLCYDINNTLVMPAVHIGTYMYHNMILIMVLSFFSFSLQIGQYKLTISLLLAL